MYSTLLLNVHFEVVSAECLRWISKLLPLLDPSRRTNLWVLQHRLAPEIAFVSMLVRQAHAPLSSYPSPPHTHTHSHAAPPPPSNLLFTWWIFQRFCALFKYWSWGGAEDGCSNLRHSTAPGEWYYCRKEILNKRAPRRKCFLGVKAHSFFVKGCGPCFVPQPLCAFNKSEANALFFLAVNKITSTRGYVEEHWVRGFAQMTRWVFISLRVRERGRDIMNAIFFWGLGIDNYLGLIFLRYDSFCVWGCAA